MNMEMIVEIVVLVVIHMEFVMMMAAVVMAAAMAALVQHVQMLMVPQVYMIVNYNVLMLQLLNHGLVMDFVMMVVLVYI